ncbi:hypothetical protein Vadar_013352 [Vaccinium darrowii]|uniref:Uncharacterized protein n=1 Tax=Vaccinium darrowii TaxID=229202 RepID=A0ACB7X0W0_9ERIC|nr:hypothetical protein Vadar_013352 [Vaccinium darrowii]
MEFFCSYNEIIEFNLQKLTNTFSVKVHAVGGKVEEFARLIVSGACRGDAYVKYPSWYDVFLLYRVFVPNILNWTFRMLLSNNGARRTSLVGTGRPLLEGSPPRKLLASPFAFSQTPLQQQQQLQMQRME